MKKIFVVGMVIVVIVSLGVAILTTKKEDKINIEKARTYSKTHHVDYILSLLEENDIIEISILSNDQIIKLGASSDCHPGSSHFFDKNYYINSKKGITIEELRGIINNYSTNSKVCVVAIDGIPPNTK